MLGDVEETIYVVEEDENEEETVKVCLGPQICIDKILDTILDTILIHMIRQTLRKQEEMLFVRGKSPQSILPAM